MRYAFALIAVLVGFLVGYYLKTQKKNHVKLLADFSIMCDILQRKINFTCDKIGDLLSEVSEQVGKNCSSCLEVIKDKLGNSSEEIRGSLQKELPKYGLKTNETKIVSELASSLGRSDASSQKQILERFSAEWELCRKEAEEDCVKNGRLCQELGILFGIGIGILIL